MRKVKKVKKVSDTPCLPRYTLVALPCNMLENMAVSLIIGYEEAPGPKPIRDAGNALADLVSKLDGTPLIGDIPLLMSRTRQLTNEAKMTIWGGVPDEIESYLSEDHTRVAYMKPEVITLEGYKELLSQFSA